MWDKVLWLFPGEEQQAQEEEEEDELRFRVDSIYVVNIYSTHISSLRQSSI